MPLEGYEFQSSTSAILRETLTEEDRYEQSYHDKHRADPAGGSEMSSIDIRVAEALGLIADHVRKRGMEHPEGLTASLPLPESGGEVIVTAHVYVEEPQSLPIKSIYDGKL